MRNLLNKYKQYIFGKIFSIENTDFIDIEYWRNKLFSYLIMLFLPLAVVAYIPNIIMAYISEMYAIMLVDTLALIALLVITYAKNLSLKIKKIIFISVFYALALVLLYYLGNIGPGLIYLVAISILIILLYSTKFAYYSIAINFIFSFVPYVSNYIGAFHSKFLDEYSIGASIAFGTNLLMLNGLTVLGVSVILKGLQKTVLKQHQLKEELKQESENLKKAKEKAEESDKLKSAFLANMSHEIRTPMNGIIGFTELLRDDDTTKEEKNEYIDLIKSSGERLVSIINDLIDISKIESGQMDVNKIRFDINDTIDDLYKFFVLQTNHKNINFKTHKEISDKSFIINSDKTKINQILINLIKNAIKFTNEGEIHFGYSINNNNIEFFVKDTGIGISNNDLQKIFKRFSQVHTELHSGYDGAGLGLSISKSFIELLGGQITVESELDKGSKFTFYIPLND